MRVSGFDRVDKTIFNVNLLQEEMLKNQVELSTGKAFEKLSEDPVKGNQLILLKTSTSSIAQYQKNINDANGFIQMNETTMASAIQTLQNSRDLGLQASSQNFSASDRATFAQQLEQNIQQLVDLGNTNFQGKYIFAGEKTQTKPFTYDGTTVTYNGDSTNITMKVSNTVNLKVSDTGDVAFQSMITSLIDLRDKVLAGDPTNINTSVDNLDKELDKAIGVRADAGTKLDMLKNMDDIYESAKNNLAVRQENVEGIDFTKVVTEFTNAQRLYQGALMANSKMMSTSLMNYIS